MANLLQRLFCFAPLGLLTAQAPPPVPVAIEDLLPASTYAVMRFEGLAACSDVVQSMPLTAVVEAFVERLPARLRAERLEPGIEHVAAGVRRALRGPGLAPDDVRAVMGCPAALAIGRVSIEAMGPSVALFVAEGQAGAAIDRCLGVAMAAVVRAGGVASDVDIDGVAMRRVDTPAGFPLFTGKVAGCRVLTNSQPYLREILAVTKGAPGLRKASALGALAAKSDRALAATFVDAAKFTHMLDPHLPYEAGAMADALGIGHLEAIYAAVGAGQDGGGDTLHLGLRGSSRGLAKALFAGHADLAFAKRCSNNTVLFVAGNVDVPAFVDAVPALVALLPLPAQQNIHRGLDAAMKRELGHSAREVDRAIRAFGTHVALAVGLDSGGSPKPEILMQIEVRDRAVVSGLLQKLEEHIAAASGAEWRTRQVDGDELRFCSVPIPGIGLQIQPCYALTDEGLVVASDVAALVRVLRRAPGDDESLAAAADFRALAQEIDGASGVVHVRAARAVELGWPLVERWIYPRLDEQAARLGFGSDALPDSASLAAAVGTSTLAWRVGDDGVDLRARGVLTLGSFVAALGWGADEVLRRCGETVY